MDLFYFVIVYWGGVIGEVIVLIVRRSLLFLNRLFIFSFASLQFWKQGRSLRGTAPGGDYKSIKLFKVSDRDL